MLFWRALTAFLVLPGTIAFLIPWWMRPPGESFGAIGWPPFGIGVILLLWCVRDFYVAGRGSLAPWAPPKNLVVVGLYRASRNPMYIGVLLILCGWALAYQSRTLWLYAAIVAIGFHARVVLYEEPWLAARYGDEYAAYKRKVPRWLGPRRSE